MALAKFTIEGRLDGLNEYTKANRSNRYAGAQMKARNEARVLEGIEAAGLTGLKIREPVLVSFFWYEKDRRRDADNVAFAKKFVLDALVKCGILEGDDPKHVAGFSDSVLLDKDNPRIIVVIYSAPR